MSDNELQRQWADELASQARSGRISRRDIIRKASVFGLSVPLIASVLSACGSDGEASSATGGATTPAAGTSAPGATTAPAGSTAPSSGAKGGILTVGALTPSTEVDPVTGFDGAAIAIFQLT